MLAYVNKEKEKAAIQLLNGKITIYPNKVTDISSNYNKLHLEKDFKRLVKLGWIILTNTDPFFKVSISKPVQKSEPVEEIKPVIKEQEVAEEKPKEVETKKSYTPTKYKKQDDK